MSSHFPSRVATIAATHGHDAQSAARRARIASLDAATQANFFFYGVWARKLPTSKSFPYGHIISVIDRLSIAYNEAHAWNYPTHGV